jgi:hypothetical protein
MHIMPTAFAPRSEPAAPLAGRAGPAAPQAAPPAVPGSSLWELLTPEERDFFARLAEMGPLTYGPRRPVATAAPTGGRIDLRG